MKRDDFENDVWPFFEKTWNDYKKLAPREVPIVFAASNDALLEHMLNKRLIDPKAAKKLFEPHNALGASSNRREIAYQIGLISEPCRRWMELVSTLRNIFAHHVRADYQNPAVLRLYPELRKAALGVVDECFSDTPELEFTGATVLMGFPEGNPETEQYLELLNSVHAHTQILFSGLANSIDRLSCFYVGLPRTKALARVMIGLLLKLGLSEQVLGKLIDVFYIMFYKGIAREMCSRGELRVANDGLILIPPAESKGIKARAIEKADEIMLCMKLNVERTEAETGSLLKMKINVKAPDAEKVSGPRAN